MTSKQIVVVTDHKDAHLPYVQRHLAEPMVIFDPRDIAHNKTLSYVYTGGKQQVLYDGIILDPKSIWFRKPRTVDADMLDIDPQFHDYALGSLQQHTMALLTAFDDALWVSDFYA